MNTISSLLDFTAKNMGVVKVSKTGLTGTGSFSTTITNTGTLPKHVIVYAVLSNPSAQTSDWTVNTDTADQVTISGSISGTTNIDMYFELQTN